MTLYRNKYNLQYYRVIQGRVSYSKDTIVWWPSMFTARKLLDYPNIFEVVEHTPITLENK
jgi:hypothetical protein